MKILISAACACIIGATVYLAVGEWQKSREVEAIAGLNDAAGLCEIEMRHKLSTNLCSKVARDAIAAAQTVMGNDRAFAEMRKLGWLQ